MSDRVLRVIDNQVRVSVAGAALLAPIVAQAAASAEAAEGFADDAEAAQAATEARVKPLADELPWLVRFRWAERLLGGFRAGDGAFVPERFVPPAESITKASFADDAYDVLQRQLPDEFPPSARFRIGTRLYGEINPTDGFRLYKTTLPATATMDDQPGVPLADRFGGDAGGATENTDYVAWAALESGVLQVFSQSRAGGLVRQLTDDVTGSSLPRLDAADRVIFYRRQTAAPAWVSAAGGKVHPFVPPKVLAAYGDSMTAGVTASPWPAQLAALRMDWSISNRGIGGQTSSSIVARQGGLAFSVSVTGDQIPASGPVTITARSGSPITSSGAQSFTGTLAGVPGTLASADSGVTYTFTRTEAGDEVACPPGTPFIFDLALVDEDAVQTLWIGRNDTSSTLQTVVKANVVAAIANLKAYAPRYVVIGVTTRSDGTEDAGSAVHDDVIAYNADQAATYGTFTFDAEGAVTGETAGAESSGVFLDIQAYMISYGLGIAGITPTTDDTDAIAAGTIPPSLLVAEPARLHFNDAGNGVVAYVLDQIFTWKGW